MMLVNTELIQKLSSLGPRGAFGYGLMEAARADDGLMVLTADLSSTSRVRQFEEAYPERFANVGISEQNMVTMAAGIALEGRTVFCTSFAAFISMRACEQVRTDVAYMKANVKLVGADAGVTIGTQGYTHYAIEDLAIMRAMPNMTVIAPADGLETAKAVQAAAQYEGPVYIRLTGKGGFPPVYKEDYDFTIGKGVMLRDGADAAILAAGAVVANALEAAELLRQEHGLQVAVADLHTVKPLDGALVRALASRVPLLVTAEEHNILGGLGAAVCEEAGAMGAGARVVRCGVPDVFSKVADYPDQLERFGLSARGLADAVLQGLGK
ncbi:hypothetical protein LI291_11595 [Intestinibacillus massiliensis]|nr:hypothetical protein [Intestinibacillus massiliensis]